MYSRVVLSIMCACTHLTHLLTTRDEKTPDTPRHPPCRRRKAERSVPQQQGAGGRGEVPVERA